MVHDHALMIHMRNKQVLIQIRNLLLKTEYFISVN